MKKVTFYKSMCDGSVITATGYQQYYTISGTDIEISLIFEKQGHQGWVITEEKSGLLASWQWFRTRAEAEESVTMDFLRKVEKSLPFAEKCIKRLNIERAKRAEV